MKHALRGLLLGAGLTSVATMASAPRISMTGFGEVRVGISAAALGRALGKKIDPAKDGDEVACRYASPNHLYDGIEFMLLDGRVARLDVHSPNIRTLSGIAIGDSQATVIKVYGTRLLVEPHAYEGPEAKYLTIYSKDKRYGVRFETDGAKVTRYYVGTAEAVQYIEGCS